MADQEIVFGPAPGLTVVYGENGAGKSGYARVIKRACRARGEAQEIKPNVYETKATGPAKAKISFYVGEANRSVEWIDGSTSDPHLGNIFVFDSFSAEAHVGRDGPACFKPRGLEVLPELARVCDVINRKLKEEIDAEYANQSKTRSTWKYSASTAAGRLVNSINATTDHESIEAIAQFTKSDSERLEEITTTLTNDPKLKAAETSAVARRIRTFAKNARATAVSVDETAMQGIAEAIEEARASSQAAEAASGPELSAGELPGTCGSVWRKLWEAARLYSQEAYPDKEFPAADTDSKCLLCQQPLQPEALDRFERFNRFVENKLRKDADEAKAKVTSLLQAIQSLRPLQPDFEDIKVDLNREAKQLAEEIKVYTESVDARVARAKKQLSDLEWEAAQAPVPFDLSLLEDLAERLDLRAKSESASADPRQRAALQSEQSELVDKRWLFENKKDIKGMAESYALIDKLAMCQKDCASRPISDKAKELDAVHVTQAFCQAFADERCVLGLDTLPVSLSRISVSKGESRFAIVADGVHDSIATVDEIASEGEHRCIALAAFFAELSQASHKSALVFDDPVSSLDHKRRDEIAKRLVVESDVRQVVVFTHDLAFVCDLKSAAQTAGKHVHCLHIERVGGRPGKIGQGLIWDAKTTKEQIKDLRDRIGRADKIYRESIESEYKKEANALVDDMRSACERIIEDVLLSDVLKRHSSHIKMGNVDKIASVEPTRWHTVKRVWKECSSSTASHANAKSGPHKVPTPDKLKEWLEDLDATIKTAGPSQRNETDVE